MLVVFCKPILAILLQRKRLIARMNHACLLCFVTPSLQKSWHATKTQYNMRKTLAKMQQHRFRTKMNYNQTPGRHTAYTWVLKSGLCSTFHLNHFQVTIRWYVFQRLFKWNVLKPPRFEYSRVRCKSLPGLVIIHFGSKPKLLHFCQRFSHVVLRFSCISPWHCGLCPTQSKSDGPNSSSVVGNSPLNLDESPTGLGNVMRTFLSHLPGVIVQTTRKCFTRLSWFHGFIAEHGIPDFISFMPALRALNPVFWPKRASKIGDSWTSDGRVVGTITPVRLLQNVLITLPKPVVDS